MKQYRGFTIIEMLAVIGVIGILAILTLPNILKQVRDAKKDAFIDEAKVVYTKAVDNFVLGKTKGNKIRYISNEENATLNELSLQNAEDLIYTVTLDKKGNVTSFVLKNDDFCIVGIGDFLKDITKEDVIDLKDIGKGVDPEKVAKCQATVIHQPETNLALNLKLKRVDADNGATPHIPNLLTLKYTTGWYINNQKVEQIESVPTLKNSFYEGSYIGDTQVIDCDGNILLDLTGSKDGVSLYPDRQTQEITAIANFSKKYFTVNFDGGSGSRGSMNTYTCTYGEDCTLPVLGFSKTGYTFNKWKSEGQTYSNEEHFGILSDNREEYNELKYNNTCENGNNIKNNKTFEALWTANQYTVTLDGNGATTTGSTSATVTYDSTTLSPVTIPQRKHTVSFNGNSQGATFTSTALTSTYTFNGWYTAGTDGSKVANNSATPELQPNVSGYTDSNKKWIKAGNATLYAQWTSSPITLPTITKTGYTCSWYDAASGGNKIANSGENYTPTGSITLYAKCEPNQYTVTFNVNGGSEWTSSKCGSGYTLSGSTCTKNVTYDGTYGSLPTPARTGYTFDGWYTAASGGTKKVATTKVTSTSNHTLHAHWTAAAPPDPCYNACTSGELICSGATFYDFSKNRYVSYVEYDRSIGMCCNSVDDAVSRAIAASRCGGSTIYRCCWP